ncbi:MAG: type II restriction endonuclease, partial [Bacteriovoracia bacterium]
MNEILPIAINSCINSEVSFTKFISANDAGKTGGHQAGFYTPVAFCPHVFECSIIKDNSYEKFVEVKWQNDFLTQSRFKYYGSKNEGHFTRFQKNFPFLTEDNVGNLLVVSKISSEYYEAFVLSRDEEIDGFFDAFGISSTETNKILPKTTEISLEERLLELFRQFINNLNVDFPPTIQLANGAREIFFNAHKLTQNVVIKKPDVQILNWITTEFELFKAIENDRYGDLIRTPFKSVEELIRTANILLNRRKSRAGKSLEHHLSAVFNIWNISYDSQAITEENKKPDFIFPSIDSYFSEPVGSEKLFFLGAKTTCKDRWRQIVGEADRIPGKHLFTLQQGISTNQLKEMKAAGITLVVPNPFLSKF